jgi:hypothetical protein
MTIMKRTLATLLYVAAAATATVPAAAAAPVNQAALQRVTPESAVLIYVDYVTGLDNLMNTIPPQQYRNNVAAFSKFNVLFKIPAVILGEETEYYGTFFPEITKNVTYDTIKSNRTTISGYTPAVRKWLKAKGRKNVIIGGISIDNCTLATALDLLRDGYNVYVVVDVSGSNSKLAEDAALMRLRDAGAVTVGWLNMATELGGDFASPVGKDLMGLVGAHWPASTVGPVTDLTPDGHGMQLPGIGGR